MFCEKPPKGFEKYFKPPGSASAQQAKQANKAGESGTSKDGSSSNSAAEQSASQSNAPPGATSRKNDWNLGMFSPQPARGKGGSSGSGGSGRPIGGGEEGDKEKMLMFGALAGVALISAIAFFEMGYKEIAWKEFVNKYVSARGR